MHADVPTCAAGGELFDRIMDADRYSERDAADTIRTIIQTVADCHSAGARASLHLGSRHHQGAAQACSMWTWYRHEERAAFLCCLHKTQRWV